MTFSSKFKDCINFFNFLGLDCEIILSWLSGTSFIINFIASIPKLNLLFLLFALPTINIIFSDKSEGITKS